MSSASTTRTIKFISKAGTYMATIMCPDGDLFQYWDGTGVDQTVFPNFETMKPKLNFICTSSRVAEGIANIASMRYYFGGAEITFNSSGYSTGLFGDGTAEGSYFKRYAADGNTLLYPGLQILKNIAAIASYLPVTIKMVATIYYGTQEDSISADYTIPIQQKAQFAGRLLLLRAITRVSLLVARVIVVFCRLRHTIARARYLLALLIRGSNSTRRQSET